jgi:hypothetical protein
MIIFNKIEPQTVEVWNKDGFFARVNQYEFNDIRIQIKNNKVEEFYIFFDNQKFYINKDGRVANWPIGLFDLFADQLTELLS